jgi:hypothetical protein
MSGMMLKTAHVVSEPISISLVMIGSLLFLPLVSYVVSTWLQRVEESSKERAIVDGFADGLLAEAQLDLDNQNAVLDDADGVIQEHYADISRNECQDALFECKSLITIALSSEELINGSDSKEYKNFLELDQSLQRIEALADEQMPDDMVYTIMGALDNMKRTVNIYIFLMHHRLNRYSDLDIAESWVRVAEYNQN